MRSPLVLLILGIVIVVGTFVGNVRQRRLQDSRAADVRLLRLELDSTRAAMAAASGAADSARLSASISERTRLLARREGHQESPATVGGWWTLTGSRTIVVTVGVALIALSAFLIRRESRSAS